MNKARGGASGDKFKHAVALPVGSVTCIATETKPLLDKTLPVPVFRSMQDVRGR